MTGWLKVLYEVLLVVGSAASWGFVAYYSAAYRWWRNEFGRHLVSMSACVGGFYVYFLLVTFWPNIPGRTTIRLVLFVILTGLLVWRLVVFTRVRRQDRIDSTTPVVPGG